MLQPINRPVSESLPSASFFFRQDESQHEAEKEHRILARREWTRAAVSKWAPRPGRRGGIRQAGRRGGGRTPSRQPVPAPPTERAPDQSLSPFSSAASRTAGSLHRPGVPSSSQIRKPARSTTAPPPAPPPWATSAPPRATGSWH